MKNLISLIIITVLSFSFISCENVKKNENVIYEDLFFTVLKLDDGKVIILPKDNNDKQRPIVITEKDYRLGKFNVSIDK